VPPGREPIIKLELGLPQRQPAPIVEAYAQAVDRRSHPQEFLSSCGATGQDDGVEKR
jgi:hypothetical protein